MAHDVRHDRVPGMSAPLARPGSPEAVVTIRGGGGEIRVRAAGEARVAVEVVHTAALRGEVESDRALRWSSDAELLADASLSVAAGDEFELRGPILVLDGGAAIALRRRVTGERSFFGLELAANADRMANVQEAEAATTTLPLAREELKALASALHAAAEASTSSSAA